jgi:hypothetical protein
VKEDITYSYDCCLKAIPDILEQDWDFVFSNQASKDIAIYALDWYFNREEKEGTSACQWFLDGKIRAQRGYFDGLLSFSLNVADMPILKTLMSLIRLINTNNSLNQTLSLIDLVMAAQNIAVFTDYTRCVFLKCIYITDNQTSHSFTSIDILREYERYNGECPCRDFLSCTRYDVTERYCLLNRNQEDIDKVLAKLVSKKAIRYVEKTESYFIK